MAVAIVYNLRHPYQCLLRSTIRAEAVAAVAELAFIDGGQYLGNGLLYHPVHYRGDAQQTLLAVVLGYLYPADGIWTVRPLTDALCQCVLVRQQIAEQTLAVHSVYPSRPLVAHHLTVSSIEVGGRQNLLHQRVSRRLLRSETSVDHAHEGLHSHSTLGFRPTLLRAAVTLR